MMGLICINMSKRPGYSKLDWEYAKRKLENPAITFEDILKEEANKILLDDRK